MSWNSTYARLRSELSTLRKLTRKPKPMSALPEWQEVDITDLDAINRMRAAFARRRKKELKKASVQKETRKWPDKRLRAYREARGDQTDSTAKYMPTEDEIWGTETTPGAVHEIQARWTEKERLSRIASAFRVREVLLIRAGDTNHQVFRERRDD